MGGLFGSNQTTSGQSNTNQTTSQNTTGQSNTATSQAYNPYGSSYLTSALQAGIPGALNAVGAANPYYNTASNYFSNAAGTPNVSAYFNPLAGAVTSQLQNIFGQQNSQNTGQLTQAAGGVGADRIAVGQSELANQQGLSAGQTLAGLYTPALGAAQQGQQLQYSAGKGMGNLGNSVLSAALQPYQSAASIAGSLAPALGGQTTGTGTTNTSAQGYGTTTGTTTGTQTTQSNPSLFSDITNLAGLFLSRGGRTNPFARGGSVNPFAFADGGAPDDDYYSQLAQDLPAELATPRREWGPSDWGAMGASAVDPFGLPSAAAKAVAPGFGQKWQDLEAAHPEASFAGSMLTPSAVTSLPARGLGMAAKLARAYPATAAGIGAGGLLAAGTADAGDAPAGRPDFTVEDRGRLNQLEKDIPLLTKQKQNAINQVGKSRIGAVAQSYDEQIAAKQAEIDRMRSSMQKQQEDYDKAGQPLAMRDPDTVDRIRKGAMMLSAGTGVLGGLSKTPIAKTLIGGLAEGAAGAYAPTMIDMFKPTDTQAYKMAHENVWSPDYFKNVIAPELAYNTVLAGAGHGVGAAGREGVTAARDAVGSLFRRSEPSALPSAPVSAPATQAGKVWPKRWQDIDMKQGKDGSWYEAGTGHKVPARLRPPTNLAPGNSIPAEARGGAVNPFAFADGGSPDDSLRYVPSFDEGMAGYYGSIAGGSPPPVDASDIVLGDYGAGKRPSAPAPGTDILPGAGVGSRGIPDPSGSGLAYADPGPATPPPRSALASIDPESQGAYNQPPMRGPATNPYAGPQSDIPTSDLPSPAAGNYRLPGGVEGFLQKAGIVSPGVGDYLSGLGMRARALAGHGDIDKAAMQLEAAAKYHAQLLELDKEKLEQAQRMQQFEMSKPYASGQVMDPNTGYPLTTYTQYDPVKGWHTVDPLRGGVAPSDSGAPPPAGPTRTQVASLKPGIDVPEGVNLDVLANNPNARTIQAIDEGRESLTSVPPRLRQQVERDLNNYDPQFDQTTWNLRNKQRSDLASNGTDGKMINAVNQLLPHLNTASEQAAELQNSNYPEANTIRNWWLTATGDARVKKFQSVREVAATDAARLLRGTGAMSEKDIDEWRKNIGEAGSPAQLQGVISQLSDDLIGARISSIQHGYRTNMGKEPPDFVSPEAHAALSAIKKRAAGTAGATGPGGGFTGRTATNPNTGAKLRETADGKWVP